MSSEEYGKEHDFDEAIRDVGTSQEGQCIWGFINGIWNRDIWARNATQMISKMTGGQKVWSLINNWFVCDDSGLIQCFEQKWGLETQIVKNAAKFFQLLLEISQQDPKRPPVVLFLHSQGTLIGNLALDLLSEQDRKQLRIFTFGGAEMIPPGKAHDDSHNFISLYDAVPKVCLAGELACEIYGGAKKGLNPQEALDQMIQEKLMRLLDTSDANTWSSMRQKYMQDYLPVFPLLTNITVLDELKKMLPLEHFIDAPCYKNKLEQIIRKYMDFRSSQSDKAVPELVSSI